MGVKPLGLRQLRWGQNIGVSDNGGQAIEDHAKGQ